MREAIAYLEGRVSSRPKIGVVLGSGLGAFADELTESVEIPYSEIPGWPQSTAVGHAGKLVFGKLGDLDVVVMSKLGAVTNDNVDEMVALVDQIKAFLRFKSPLAGVAWASAASPTICSVDALREFMQFTGQFTLTYRYMEGRA